MGNLRRAADVPDDEIRKKFHVKRTKRRTGDKVYETYELPAAFDIETSSFRENGEKRAVMYLWQFDLGGLCVYGRSWDEFGDWMCRIRDLGGVSKSRRMVIYVHNLAYEFQWIRNRFEWAEVFAREMRKPMRALTKDGFEFRCSYVLSGYALKTLAKNLHYYKIEKLDAEMDYTLLRTPYTPLTDAELEYGITDVQIVEYYIREQILRNGSITRIPMTKTSYVRREIRDRCYSPENRESYRTRMKTMTISGPDEYASLLRAFIGGFVHANAYRVDRVYEHVASVDLTSSYPTVMIAEKFPCGAAKHLESIDDVRRLSAYCVVFDVTFFGIEAATDIDHPISASKCYVKNGWREDNGRIVSADCISITLTDVDMEYVRLYYTWQRADYTNVWAYPRQYLPTPFVEGILSLYQIKTELKGVKGKEREYLAGKENLNSSYGMTVTNILRDEIVYDGEWKSEEVSVPGEIRKYNAGRRRFLFYPWGIYVTAYARRNLLCTMYQIGTDYIYADTDSIKFLNRDCHWEVIEQYNAEITEKLEKALTYHGLSFDLIRPQDKNGVERPLGCWTDEGVYDRFKTLGAKRYLIEENGDLQATVAGCNKNLLPTYLKQVSPDDPFEAFRNGLYVPPNYAGRLTAEYIDEETYGIVTDYLGNEHEYHELSSVNMEPGTYTMSLSAMFLDYLDELNR